MGVSYRIDPERRIIFSQYSGPIDAEAILANLRAANNDPLFEKGMDSLADFSDAQFTSMSVETIFAFFAAVQREIEEERGRCRWAVVVPDAANLGVVKLYQLMSDELQITMETFSDAEAAMEWLGRPQS